MAICPNINSEEFKDLVKKLGSEALAHAAWSKINLGDFHNMDIGPIEALIKENQSLVEGKTSDKDKDGNIIESFYIIKGLQYKRVSNVIPNDFDGDSSKYENSRIAGNTVDKIVKNFFETGDITKPDSIDKDAHAKIINALEEIQQTITDRGERFVASSIVLFDENLKIAGEVDILSIDKDGNFNIYDIKTSTEKGWKNYDSHYQFGSLSKRNNHTNQLSAYNNLLFNQYGIKAKNLGVIAFQLVYDKNGNISDAKKFEKLDTKILDYIELKYDTEIERLIPTSETKPIIPKPKGLSAYAKQKQHLSGIIWKLKKELNSSDKFGRLYDKDSDIYKIKQAKIEQLERDLKSLIDNPTRSGFELAGRIVLMEANNYLTDIESGKNKDTRDRTLNNIYKTIDAWIDIPELATEAASLLERFQSIMVKHVADKINEHSTEKETITVEKINSQNKDIITWTKGTGSLSDLKNYHAKTIGLTIKTSQNNIAIQNIKDKYEIQAEVNLLVKFAESKNITLDAVWDMLIVKNNFTLELAREFDAVGNETEEYKKIQQNPELIRFYEYYKKKIISNQEKSAFITGGQYFIANISKQDIKQWIQSKNPRKERKIGEQYSESLSLDEIPLRYDTPIKPELKNRNLAYALLAFSMHANEYSEMSEILPGLRLIQNNMMYNENDPTKEKEYISANDPNKTIIASKTNLWEIIDRVIDMQVKGRMKSKSGQVPYGYKTDLKGNITEQYLDFEEIGDDLLRYNSLLRIGFSPIGATVNLLFGDITNTIEALGGRFFSFKNLLQASKIYFTQVRDDNSVLNQIHKELNFLQNLDDYSYLEEVRLTGIKRGMSLEKAEEYMYYLQKMSENWIQSKIALAIMIRDEYLTADGKLTDKYKKATSKEKQQLSDKIQRLNHLNHGRYTTKEAAIWQQNIFYRMASQFRKWIPAAIEQRFGEYNPHDTRLQVSIEGRYLTIGRTVFKQSLTNPILALENLFLPLINAEKALAKGNLNEMEIANMRKMLVEIIIIVATFVTTIWVKSGDDDEEKKRKLKNPLVKSILTMLDRVTGDLTFFYDPSSVTNLASTTIPLTKLITDLFKTIKYAIAGYPFYVNNWEYTRGSNKGRNKFYKTLAGEIPGVKSIQDILKLGNNNALEEQIQPTVIEEVLEKLE